MLGCVTLMLYALREWQIPVLVYLQYVHFYPLIVEKICWAINVCHRYGFPVHSSFAQLLLLHYVRMRTLSTNAYFIEVACYFLCVSISSCAHTWHIPSLSTAFHTRKDISDHRLHSRVVEGRKSKRQASIIQNDIFYGGMIVNFGYGNEWVVEYFLRGAPS
jgi:hypothetical protein